MAADVSIRSTGCPGGNPSPECLQMPLCCSPVLDAQGQKPVQSGTALFLCMSGNCCGFNDKISGAQCPFSCKWKSCEEKWHHSGEAQPGTRVVVLDPSLLEDVGLSVDSLISPSLTSLAVQPSKRFVFSCSGDDVQRHKQDGRRLIRIPILQHGCKSKLL